MSIKIVKVCDRCYGNGLEPCELRDKCYPKHKCNYNVLAKNSHKYIVCFKCLGEGVPLKLI